MQKTVWNGRCGKRDLTPRGVDLGSVRRFYSNLAIPATQLVEPGCCDFARLHQSCALDCRLLACTLASQLVAVKELALTCLGTGEMFIVAWAFVAASTRAFEPDTTSVRQSPAFLLVLALSELVRVAIYDRNMGVRRMLFAFLAWPLASHVLHTPWNTGAPPLSMIPWSHL